MVVNTEIDGEIIPILIAYDTKINNLSEPEKDGYTFDNWYLNNEIFDFNTPITEDVQLEARFNIIHYSINCILNGGEATNETTYTIEDEITINNPNKEGHTFTGWTGSNGTVPTKDLKINKGTTGNKTYTANYSINSYEVTFDPNDGQVSEGTRNVTYNTAIGELPTPTYTNHIFDGWFTAPSGGTKIDKDTIIGAKEETYYAHWTYATASGNGKLYTSLQSAVSEVPTNDTQTTIELLQNVEESVNILSGQNILFDLNDYTITSTGTTVINNNGTIKIVNGTLLSNIDKVINNSGSLEIGGTANLISHATTALAIYNDGTITITGGTFASENTQTIYNNGTLEISGTAQVSSTAQSDPTIFNATAGEITISGGNTTSENNKVLYNAGTLEISGTAQVSSTAQSDPTIFNATAGEITISGGNTTSENNKVLYNAGTLEISGTAQVSSTAQSDPTIFNATAGEITISGGNTTSENNKVLYNAGMVEISGTAQVSSTSQSDATIYNSGTINILNGSVTSEHNKAIFNTGTVEISGSSIISSSAANDYTILSSNSLTITSGTVKAMNSNSIYNSGTLILGTKGGIPNITNPLIIAVSIGINTNNGTLKFYDGIVKSEYSTIYGTVSEVEDNYHVNNSSEIISGKTYNISYLSE